MDIKSMLAAKDAMIPESGFNVVELDDFASPGEELTVLSHHDSRADAEAALKQYKKDQPKARLAIYGSTDK